MNKKRIIITIWVLALIMSLAGCNFEGRENFSLKGSSIAPYEIDEREKLILKANGIMDGYPIEYNAPAEATSIEVLTYVLVEGKWEENCAFGLNFVKESPKEERTRGLISLQTDGIKREFVIDVKITSASGGMLEVASPKLENVFENLGLSPSFLDDEKKIEIEKEIPIAIYQYSTSGISTYNTESFFEPNLFKNIDLVQAVTVRFQ